MAWKFTVTTVTTHLVETELDMDQAAMKVFERCRSNDNAILNPEHM